MLTIIADALMTASRQKHMSARRDHGADRYITEARRSDDARRFQIERQRNLW